MEKSIQETRKRKKGASSQRTLRHGEGRYIFENKTSGDLQLPKPASPTET